MEVTLTAPAGDRFLRFPTNLVIEEDAGDPRLGDLPHPHDVRIDPADPVGLAALADLLFASYFAYDPDYDSYDSQHAMAKRAALVVARNALANAGVRDPEEFALLEAHVRTSLCWLADYPDDPGCATAARRVLSFAAWHAG